VWEWCSDVLNENPDLKALRGGSWNVEELMCKNDFRFLNKYDAKSTEMGFRCVLIHQQK